MLSRRPPFWNLEDSLLPRLSPALTINAERARQDEHALHDMLARNLTDDRVFGVLSCHQLDRIYRLVSPGGAARAGQAGSSGLVIIYGPGAALVHPGDVLVYADLPRWEIQQRMRSGELDNQ